MRLDSSAHTSDKIRVKKEQQQPPQQILTQQQPLSSGDLHTDHDLPFLKKCSKPKTNYRELTPIVWRNVIIMGLLHLGFLHGFILTFYCDVRTILIGKKNNFSFYC